MKKPANADDRFLGHAMGINNTTENSPIQHQRIRVPRQNNTALHLPPLEQANELLLANQRLIATQAKSVLTVSFLNQRNIELSFSSLRSQAKSEIVSLAHRYSGQYLDNTPYAPSVPDNTPIIMSGHQPELFHPGVWYKNFVLSALAKNQKGIAINLVVDSDLATQNSIRFPDNSSEPIKTGKVVLDQTAPATPFELRSISDLPLFSKFADRVRNAVSASGVKAQESLIVERLWPEVITAATRLSTDEKLPNLGASIAAGRHRLEQNTGLTTLEVPLSKVSTLKSFAIFAASILDGPERFCAIYNSVLDDYRAVHRIRSRSHPVPSLEVDDDWIEIPFWIYSAASPSRQRLFAKSTPSQLLLTDRSGRSIEIPKSNFVNEFSSLSNQGIFIRPRALMTTMFSRLFLSNIFLHGIGGAKYDQLTDAITERFFGYRLPKHLTMSATLMLPSTAEQITKADITALQQRRRELKFHPERCFNSNNLSPTAQKLVAKKRRWTSPEFQAVRTKEKHAAIAQINQQLSEFLAKSDDELRQKIELQKYNLRASQIANSREYSFCLFDSQLTAALQALVDANLGPI